MSRRCCICLAGEERRAPSKVIEVAQVARVVKIQSGCGEGLKKPPQNGDVAIVASDAADAV
jgi:hypothetical protein